MEIKKDEIQNNEGDKTPVQDNLDGKINNQGQGEDTPPKNKGAEEQEEVKVSKAEYEKMVKKATDFDGIIEKQRLQKLAKKKEVVVEPPAEDKKEIDEEKINAIINAKVSEKITLLQKDEYDKNLAEAYREFKQEHPWADNDETLSAIGDVLETGGRVDKVSILVSLGQAAYKAFPEKYEQAREERIKARLLAEESNINAGDFGGGGGSKPNGVEQKKQLTQEQIDLAIKSGNDPKDVYPEYFTN